MLFFPPFSIQSRYFDLTPSVTQTGWDVDPFIVIPPGKKVFRTRVIKHLRNPVWDEKFCG